MSTDKRRVADNRGARFLLDKGEQIVVVALWIWLCSRVLVVGNSFAPLLLASETLVVVFTLARRSSVEISGRPTDWGLAFSATALPLLVNPGVPGPQHFALTGVLLFLLGTGWQIWAKLALGRSFGIAPANRGVKIVGPYRAMRHPMYFGYFVAQLGILILMFSGWNMALYATAWALQFLRLRREEDLLMQVAEYREYAAHVPYRVIPRVF